MANVIEIEDSYVLNDEYNIYEKLEKHNFKFKEKITEEDTYYTDKEYTFITDRVCLRTRKTNEDLLELTYKPKIDNSTEKYGKREVNLALDVKDYLDTKYILSELGFEEYVSFKKERETYTKQIDSIKYSVMIDKIEGVGEYIELELLANSEEEKEKLASKLDEFVELFECDKLEEKKKPYRDIVKETRR